MDSLRIKLREWLRGQPGALEATALSNDCRGLSALAPNNPNTLCHLASGTVPGLVPLARMASELKGFLHDIIREASAFITRRAHVVPPYLGGLQGHASSAVPSSGAPQAQAVSVGVLNPGRSGFLSICTHEVLWWRLIHITKELHRKNVAICMLPSWRWPPGIEVPDDLGFQLVGTPSTSWASIGALVCSQVAHLVHQLDSFCTPRTLWLAMNLGTKSACIIGGFYAAPGGDVETWSLVLQQYDAIHCAFPDTPIVLAGDGNAHFSHVVHHQQDCSCLHCRQGTRDREIEALVNASNLNVLNVDAPTHDSGTLIDVILGESGVKAEAVTHSDNIGGSDHRLVTVSFDNIQFGVSWQPDARVCWTHGQLWTDALRSVQHLLDELADATSQATQEICSASSLPTKRKRAILDTAAWCREAVVASLGHLHGMITVRPTNKRPRRASTTSPPREPAEISKAWVSEATRKHQLSARQKFSELCSQNPGKASAFLSGILNRSRSFNIALRDECTLEPLSFSQTAELLAEDMRARADNDFPVNMVGRQQMTEVVSAIRHAGAPSTGVPGAAPLPTHTTAQLPLLYTSAEFQECLLKISCSKKSVHAPLAAVKAGFLAADNLALELCNLGRVCGLTASMWSIRHISPIRKAGPRNVTSVKNLRPISRASDMSAVQDALWLSRCKSFIDAFTDDAQMGGKFDCVAIMVALIMHAQVRHYQGLLTYFVFADLKWAFDVADVNLMLLTCYEAGIVGLDWQLLDDFFRQDEAVVVVGGCLSSLLKLGAGIPQGRRFSMHAFSASMKLLQHTMNSVAATSATVLPDFARAAPEETWVYLTPHPSPALVPLHLNRSSISSAIERCLLSGNVSDARRLAIHLLPSLPTFHERSVCLESIGLGRLGPLFFVDDVAGPYPDAASVDAILSDGLERYARLARASFNFGPQKTASMA